MGWPSLPLPMAIIGRIVGCGAYHVLARGGRIPALSVTGGKESDLAEDQKHKRATRFGLPAAKSTPSTNV